MSSSSRRSNMPPPRRLGSAEEHLPALATILADEFMVPPLAKYNVYVEGATDVAYLECAARLAAEEVDENLLEVPTNTDDGSLDNRIQICSPSDPNDPEHRGGVKMLSRLGRELSSWLRRLDRELFVMFVFDHDQAGLAGLVKLRKDGIKSDSQAISLVASKHPTACGRKNIVIEDLLSLRIQKAFFDQNSDCCVWVRHVNGEVVRFSWEHPTKDALCEYVQRQATWEDVLEVGRVLGRVRGCWGLPVNNGIFEASRPPTVAS